jgi:hypothetical protein
VLGVERVEVLLVEGGQRADRRRQHRHRVRVAGEPVEEAAQILVEQGVHSYSPAELRKLRGGGQLAVDEQVGDLQEGRLLGELLDRITAVTQDPRITVDVRDRRGARGRVDEAGIVRDVPGLLQERTDIDAGRALDRLVHGHR